MRSTKRAKEILDASDEIWGCAETAFQEDNSVKVLCDLLKKEGFAVEENLADVKTAFKGTYGSGKPVIGILGEFDALSGLNQEPCATEKKAMVDGAPGTRLRSQYAGNRIPFRSDRFKEISGRNRKIRHSHLLWLPG